MPVTGKNYFPSNIQGLPTWYEIRVSGDGYLCASGDVHIVVAMNAQTYAQDLADVTPGGTFIYDSSWPREREFQRDDVTIIGIPLAQLCNDRYDDPRTRILMKNIAYFGALVALLPPLLQLLHRRPGAFLGELRGQAGKHLVVLIELLCRRLVHCHRRLVILPEEDVVGLLLIG